jgi:SAM-dependent methyltransferase
MEPTEHNRQAWEEAHRRQRDVAGSRAGLPSPVGRALADLRGKRVLAVPAGGGDAAAELAERGATVTAVDASAESLAAAREQWPAILWIDAAPDALPRELRRGRFDLVYGADVGPDVAAWASGIGEALRAGGDLLVYAEHPVARCVDGLMHWRDSYFIDGVPRLGRIVTAVCAAGLEIRALEEYPQSTGNPRRHDARIPGTFLLHARRS